MQRLAKFPEAVSDLAAAFANAEYVVDIGPATVVVRIGELAPALERATGERPWAIVTAHNPGGVRQPADRNASAHRRLRRHLRELAPGLLLPACNRDPAGRWPDEPGWLFTPESIDQADRLARRFGQCAIVAGRPGQPAGLRMYGNWPGRLPESARAVGP